MKIGRNQPCPCGSGKKYKHCHGSINAVPSQVDIARSLQRIQAEQRIRERQQGEGRPIIALKQGEQQVVAVGNRLMWSDKWKSFPDFLGDYIKKVVGRDWGNAEIKKPLGERHPLMQWYDAYCRYQQEVIKTPGTLSEHEVVGVVACYLGVAYSLYLLDHNVELQARLLKRLKDPGQFQGAYYELLVANMLIRAGFKLALEDETDGATKHCEFSAISSKTGKKYWVEAKMRGVAGMLGRTNADGGADGKPLGSMIPHLNAALAKPASDERLIFIDLNGELPVDTGEDERPDFIDAAIVRLKKFESEGKAEGKTAYVFVTDIAWHRSLCGRPIAVMAPFGLGFPDFNRSGMFRMSERYMQNRKHDDAIRIADAFASLTKYPSTFDGKLPSEAYENSQRIMIGETYYFEGDIGVATVTAASVMPQDKYVVLGVTRHIDGSACLIKKPMTDRELADYRENSDAYFGQIGPMQTDNKTPYELFESLVEIYLPWKTEQILDKMKGFADFERIKELPHEHLVAIYCEGLVAMIQGPKPR